MTREPDVDTARAWWPAQRNVWTPIGWKDHFFRFNVVYNGILIAEPAPRLMPRDSSKPFVGKDFQLTFGMYDDGAVPRLPAEPTPLYKLDHGFGMQGWDRSRVAPVLWTEWPVQQGLVVRQEIFAHVPGGGDVSNGIEPLYAWIRLSVAHVDPIRAPERFTFGLGLSRVWVKNWVPYRLDDGVTLRAEPEHAPVPEGLRTLALDASADGGVLVSQGDSGVRLAILQDPLGHSRNPHQGPPTLAPDPNLPGAYAMAFTLPVELGAHVDLVLAMTPQPEQDFRAEVGIGRDRALGEVEAYWSRPTGPNDARTAAEIHTPERYVNEFLLRSRQFAEVVAEIDPSTGDRSFLTGSYGYDCLWATPTSMVSHMFLDLLGHHDVVDRHSELFARHQGEIHPPGKAFSAHPGYLASPKSLTSFDWFSDHGAILHQLAFHGLMTGDPDFLARWTDRIVAACDFIVDACGIDGHEGIPGLLPPAVATDELLEVVSVWNLGWSYKGLSSAVGLLDSIGHPRAEDLGRFADDFRRRVAEAYRRRLREVPTWTDPDGREFPVPQANLLEPAKRHPFGDLTLLDTGGMFLVYAGLMDARDPLMRSAVEFFRVGPNRRLYGLRPGPIDRPILIHEQSSGEPCYSWNVFHSHALGDRNRYLEGFYGLITGGIADQTYIASEHRHGMYGNLCTTGLIVWLLRHAVIDDALEPETLHLLRFAPLAWLSSDEETRFLRMPTVYGPVDLRWRLSGDRRSLSLAYDGNWRRPPGRILVHVPPLDGIERLEVNGEDYPVSPSVTLELDANGSPPA